MIHSYALRPAWTPLTIALMVIGFIVFWPLGLVMLAYIIWGHRVPELRRHFEGMKQDFRSDSATRLVGLRASRCGFTRSGNVAFDEYRDARNEAARGRAPEARGRASRVRDVHAEPAPRPRPGRVRPLHARSRRARKTGDEDKTIDL